MQTFLWYFFNQLMFFVLLENFVVIFWWLILLCSSLLSNQVVASCLHVVHISYRFLMMEPEVFCELWDWSCFLDLVRKTLDMGSHLEFAKDISDVRWCAVQVLSIILRMNDRATASLGVGAEEALSCLLRLVLITSYYQDTLICFRRNMPIVFLLLSSFSAGRNSVKMWQLRRLACISDHLIAQQWDLLLARQNSAELIACSPLVPTLWCCHSWMGLNHQWSDVGWWKGWTIKLRK